MDSTKSPNYSTVMLETPLVRYIDHHRTTESKGVAFTGLGSLKGKFAVNDEDYPSFLTLLHDYLFVQQLRPLNLVEQRRADLMTPLLIDLDFKYSPEHALERPFEMSHVHEFIRGYVDHLNHFYGDFLADHRPLRFFVTLRPTPYIDKRSATSAAQRPVKDGVHIQCPDLVLSSEHQQVLRHRSLEMHDLSRAFQGTGYTNLEADIFDEAIVKKNGWFFYGESKPDIPAYQLASIYVYDPAAGVFSEEDRSAYSPRILIELLSIRYGLTLEDVEVSSDTANEWKERLEYCQGKRGGDTTGDQKEDRVMAVAAASAASAASAQQPSVIIQVIPSDSAQQLEQAKMEEVRALVLECLSEARATPYKEWIEIGWCLHNISPAEEMFELWMEFSRKSPKFSESDVSGHRREWIKWSRSTHAHPITERSLHMWARMDNPQRYRELMQASFCDYVERHVDATHTHIARLMKLMFKNEYCAAADTKKVEWYRFTGVYWELLAHGIELRSKIATEVAEVIMNTRRRIISNMSGDGNEQLRDWNEKRLKKLLDIEKQLYQCGFKDSVLKDCISLFYEKDFGKKLNSNQYLLGFKNGVVDLRFPYMDEAGQTRYRVQFRKAEPSDFVTFLAGRCPTKNCDEFDYIEYDPTDATQREIHAEIDDFMTKIFPRPELRAYMWRKLASCLEGSNKEQTYETWIGVGGNGKSKLVEFLSMTLGDYAASLQSTAMTRKRPDSGAANPDIMAIRNKRFIYMAEPDDREPLNTSRMKQFTGEDDVEARGLFEDQTKFKITGKIFMLCNAFPAINTMDRGTWRRVRAVPFESKFVDPNVEDVNEETNVYARDDFLDEKMRTWRIYFMSRLVHVYRTEYMPHGLGKVPAIVTRESQKYQESFDSLGKFINARIREEKKGGAVALIKDVFRVYKYWYADVGSGSGRQLTMADLYKRLSDRYGEPSDKKTFKQLHLFENDEDIEAYDRQLEGGDR